ncbi:MAG TPA: hypothetical protein VN048_02430 [Verrucomicrobiae bacterium]|jgi:hypothetical protein|nr:hypothetical protein [Verrucomicrobiae bacterium]
MSNIITLPIGPRIDAISERLQDELEAHANECRSHNPKLTDDRIIFEGWAIQKIAGLHFLVLELVQRVGELEARKKR